MELVNQLAYESKMASWPKKQPSSSENVGGVGARRRTEENIGSSVQEGKDERTEGISWSSV
jgi:hypothetical protein